MSRKTSTGLLRIGRIQSGSSTDGWVEIQLEDDHARTQVVNIRMTRLDFANALMGSADQPCHFEVCDDLVGYRAENKRERVHLSRADYDRAMRLSGRRDDESRRELRYSVTRELLRDIEVDGWRVRTGDLFNHNNVAEHMGADGVVMELVFFRHVHVETGEPYAE